MTGTALILGASGKFGSHSARALEASGWKIRRFDRHKDDVNQAALGADIIVNGLNPLNYQNWATDVPRITAMAISAAKASGATLIVPGNVYPFGAKAGEWDDTTTHRPTSRKGKIRTELEASYKNAANEGVRTILIRPGDFIDVAATGTWIDLVLAKNIAKGQFSYPGNSTIPHAWAYLPDLGRAVAMLAAKRSELAPYEDISFPGYTLTGNEIQHLMQRAIGRPLKVKNFPWWLIQLASPFWKLGGELLEMRYLWNTPHSLSPARFNRLLPDFIPTKVETAIASALPVNVKPN